ncbi:unnamed protein product [Darwinula stevensoni]|uniref:Uncharacterized protein n=1 Tax=Darwinula stevensoni TaxID=69355 RepID=A0A7R9AAB7_9CRUS|nr:unnamed protein product [Darwinula stevensoni]CAG0898226.1 unnamed protein product [Darwinula stevensoni]
MQFIESIGFNDPSADRNPLQDVPAGFFSDMGNLKYFYCYVCDFGPTLSTKSLDFRSATISLQPNTYLYFGDNEIRELTEASFRPMLEVLSLDTGYINLYGLQHVVLQLMGHRGHIMDDFEKLCVLSFDEVKFVYEFS